VETSSKKPKRRRERPKEGPKQNLLATAERLFADYGLDGVSLKRIGLSAGEANNSVVQYHFGDRASLIREINANRIESLEPRRLELLAKAEAEHKLSDIRALIEVFLLPVAEAMDDDGYHVHARFMVQYMILFRHQAGAEFPTWGPESAGRRAGLLLLEQLPFLTVEHLTSRLNQLSMLFHCALVDRDNALANQRDVQKEAIFLDQVFNMVVAAIQIPLEDGTGLSA
jgi:AcrR family transcriptional regulator